MTDFHWPAFFQRSADALFVLNRHCRLVWVNAAWEELTGLSRSAARGLACRVRRTAPPEDALDLVVARALAPPPDVLTGRPLQVRRLVHLGEASHHWDVEFFPICDAAGVLGILGKVIPLPTDETRHPLPLVESLAALAAQLRSRYDFASLGESPAVHRFAAQARLAAQTRVAVTLRGEAGVGKEWVARVIHHQGPLRGKPFAVLDCRRLPAVAVAAALFEGGRLVRRAGTIFLREPACLSRDLQAVLEAWMGEVTGSSGGEAPRVIAGCRGDPADDVRSGRLTEELAAALGVLVIDVPPLRERKADLPRLAEVLLRPLGGTLTREALALLLGHTWPGNVRELRRAVADARAAAPDGRIEARHIPFYLRPWREPAAGPVKLPLDELLEKVERRLLELALRKCGGKQEAAAQLLGIWRARVSRRLKALGILGGEAE